MSSTQLTRLAALLDQERYRVDDAAELLGVSVDVVQRAVDTGTLLVADAGATTTIAHADLVQWLERRPYAAIMTQLAEQDAANA